MAELPRGTVSMLFTDIEGSTQLQHRLGERYRQVVVEHRELLEEAIQANGGHVVDRQTESFFAVFPRMRDAAAAAAGAQRALEQHEWPEGTRVRVRMGLHAGEPELDDDRYVGLAVARAARVAATAHGGQVLLSGAARSLISDERLQLRGLGSHPLKDFDSPEPLYQLVVDGLPAAFPPPRTGEVRSRRRRKALTLGAAGIVVAVGAVAAVLLFTRGGDTGLASVHPNSVGVVDAKTSRIIAEVPVGIRPGPIAFGKGSVWVGNVADRTLTRVNIGTRANAGTISLGNQTPTGIAVGEGAVWVAHGFLGKLSRVDPEFGQVTKTLDLAGTSGNGVVAVGDRAVWAVYGESTLARVDPVSVRLLGRGLAGASPSGIVVANGAVWVTNSGDQTGTWPPWPAAPILAARCTPIPT